MRISSSAEDRAAYESYHQIVAKHGFPDVYLDGSLQSYCVLADDDRGEILRCALDHEGMLQLDPGNPNLILMETARGVVEIRFRTFPDGA